MSTTGRSPGPNLRHKARRVAVQAIYQWQLTAQAPEDIVRQLNEDSGQGRIDKKFFAELVYGVTTEVEKLDEALGPFLDRTIREVDPVERAILRLGAWELLHRLDIPLRVVINEGVELARVYGAEAGHRYVNGVLDSLARASRPEAGAAARPRES